MGEPIAEVGQLAGVCGHDGTNWEKILIDASKRLVVAVDGVSVTIEVSQDTPGDLLMGQHQYDGTAWRKSNLLWGYHDTILERVMDLSAATGVNYLDGTAVASGEIWVYTNIATYNHDTNPSDVQLGVQSGADFYVIGRDKLPGTDVTVGYAGMIPLKEGEYIRSRIAGCTSGDDIYLFLFGYKMDITM